MKGIIRLKIKELMKAQIDYGIKTDADLAALIGVSPAQIWRIKQGRNLPGPTFIAGVLVTFNAKFEDFFYVEKVSGEVRKIG